MKIYAYARVSTNETKQSTERQLDAFKKWEKENNRKIDKIYEEYASGKSFDRKLYQEMKDIIQKDDILIVKELDRFGRSMDKIKDEWNFFMNLGVRIIVIDMPLISSDLKGDKTLDMRFIANLVFEVLCYSAEKEREKLSQRTKEALAVKKAQGVKLGRKFSLTDDQVKEFKLMYEDSSISIKTIAKHFGITDATVNNYVKQLEIPTRYNKDKRKKKK